MEGAEGKIYLELDAYELGQVVALLPDVAWNRMDRELRQKIKAAQEQIQVDRVKRKGLQEIENAS